MCDCEKRLHPGFSCGSPACPCHPELDVDLIYMSISFPRVSRSTAFAIVKAAEIAAGQISYNVFYEESSKEDSDTNG